MITILNRILQKIYIFIRWSNIQNNIIIKDETFILLYGDCKLILDNKEYFLQKNKPISVQPKVIHSFLQPKEPN